MSVVTRPARMIPARKTSGSRTRSEPNRITALFLRVPLRVLRRRDLVTDTPHGDDRRGVAELPPQLADMDVDGAGVARKGVAPDALEELVARQHEPAVIEELPQQVEF